MLVAYVPENDRLARIELACDAELPAGAVWVDMLSPTPDEARTVESALKIDLPTREEMQEIEASSRLYSEDGGLFMTATLVARAETDSPEARPVTFVLTGNRLVTIRHSEPTPFRVAAARLQRPNHEHEGVLVLGRLLDAIVDRLADVLEKIAFDVDAISREIFEHGERGAPISRDYHELLKRIGRNGDLNTKARESLVSIGRLLTFLSQKLGTTAAESQLGGQLATLNQDVHSLTDHASFLSNKINFLLEALLGMLSIEQNAIIKIFSVAAVAFLPPTLIASIYGMNFEFMPELEWPFGYPLALGLMVISAILPYWYFKRRGWL